MKDSISQMKNTVESLSNRLSEAEERISKLEEKSFEIDILKGRKKIEKSITAFRISGILSSDQICVSWELLKKWKTK